MDRDNPWVARGAVYVLAVGLLALVGSLVPGLFWMSVAAGVLTLPAGVVVGPLVGALAIGLNSLVPGVTDPGSLHPALMSVPATVVSAVLNLLLLRTLLRARAPKRRAPHGGVPMGPAPTDSTSEPTGTDAADEAQGPGPGDERPAGRSTALLVVAVLAFVGQAVVAMGTFLMGLGWGGPTYYAALLQVLLAFGVIGRLVSRRRRIAALVPLVSAALTALLLVAGQQYAEATGCGPRVQAVAGELAAPPGADARLTGGMEGCFARFETDLSVAEVGEHYSTEFDRHGWERDAHTDGAAGGTKDGIRATVYTEPLPGGRAHVAIEFFEMPSGGQ